MPDIMRFYDFKNFLNNLLESGYSYNYFGNNVVSDLMYIFLGQLLFQRFQEQLCFRQKEKDWRNRPK